MLHQPIHSQLGTAAIEVRYPAVPLFSEIHNFRKNPLQTIVYYKKSTYICTKIMIV
jgi:hypothetical protein